VVLRVEIVVREEGGEGVSTSFTALCLSRNSSKKSVSFACVEMFVSVYTVGIGFHSKSASMGQSQFSVKVMQPGYSTAGGS
jgi:hypothetical protein